MKHENIYQHNIRLNLNKEDHLLVHRYLMNADPREFKSKNDFLIRAVLAGAPSVCQGETVKAEEVEVKLSEEQMKELSLKVVDLLKVYEEFLVLNKGFVSSEFNTDIELPKSVKVADAVSYKSKIEEVLKTEDLSKLLEYLPEIL